MARCDTPLTSLFCYPSRFFRASRYTLRSTETRRRTAGTIRWTPWIRCREGSIPISTGVTTANIQTCGNLQLHPGARLHPTTPTTQQGVIPGFDSTKLQLISSTTIWISNVKFRSGRITTLCSGVCQKSQKMFKIMVVMCSKNICFKAKWLATVVTNWESVQLKTANVKAVENKKPRNYLLYIEKRKSNNYAPFGTFTLY